VKLIQPNCRVQFTAADIDFVISVFGSKIDSNECLVKLLADPDTRDEILDDELIFRALLERNGFLNVSSHFYFYILVRHVFRQAGIDDREVADYVSEMLAEFSKTERARCPLPNQSPMDYLFEMLIALQKADDSTQFQLRTHLGNHSLFLSGIFIERIHYRAQYRGAPDVDYYETLGRSSFRVARDHRLAQKYELALVLDKLSDQFHDIRLALNDMSDRIISLGDREDLINKMLRSET